MLKLIESALEKYEALITLPEDAGIPGMSGSISRTETGVVDRDSKIILSATKEIKKGDAVRWENY